jgi:hypothetical protein
MTLGGLSPAVDEGGAQLCSGIGRGSRGGGAFPCPLELEARGVYAGMETRTAVRRRVCAARGEAPCS